MDKAFDDVCMMSILQSSKMFEGLSKEQIKQLILGKKVQMVRYKKNDILFWTDKKPDYLYMLMDGNIAMAKNTMSGSRILSQSITKKGEMTGDIRLFSEKVGLWEYAVAMEDSNVLRIDSHILLDDNTVDPIIQNILLRNLLSNAVDRIERIGQKVRYLSMPSVRQRIAYYLLSIQQEDGKIVISATQENIADYIGIARPSLSRELGKMQNDGLIQMENRKVKILDREAFEKLIES